MLCLLSFSCEKEVVKNSDKENDLETANRKTADGTPVIQTVANLTIDSGMTLAQMNQVIAAASAGQTVKVAAGTYNITGKIIMKAGVTLMKKTTVNPIFNARNTSTEIYKMSYGTDLNNCTFSGITFWNIKIYAAGTQNLTISNCVFDYGERQAGTDEKWYGDAYVQYLNANHTTVSNCTFSRRSTDSGRGIWVGAGSVDSKILNNTFGNGGTTGYFVTAINDNSQSTSLIDGNIINRNAALNSDNSQTDHGIYAHSFNGLTISGNTISGWPASGDGGAVKARNGENLVVSGNTFNTSGILLYTYVNPTDHQYLKNVKVLNNTINLPAPTSGMTGGIGYYREAGTTGIEYSVRIEGNQLPNGAINISASNGFNATNFNAALGGIYNNNLYLSYLSLPTGVNNSGNY